MSIDIVPPPATQPQLLPTPTRRTFTDDEGWSARGRGGDPQGPLYLSIEKKNEGSLSHRLHKRRAHTPTVAGHPRRSSPPSCRCVPGEIDNTPISSAVGNAQAADLMGPRERRILRWEAARHKRNANSCTAPTERPRSGVESRRRVRGPAKWLREEPTHVLGDFRVVLLSLGRYSTPPVVTVESSTGSDGVPCRGRRDSLLLCFGFSVLLHSSTGERPTTGE